MKTSDFEDIQEAMLLDGADEPSDQHILDVLGESADVEATRKAYKQFLKDQAGAKPDAAKAKPATKQAQPKPATAAAKPPVTSENQGSKKIVLRNADGTSTDLELVKETGSAVFVRVPEAKAKDEVTIILKGKPVIVDVNELLDLDPETARHGLPVSTLLIMAAAAK